MIRVAVLLRRFKQFGGWHLAVAYLRMGLFWTCCKLGLSIFSGRMSRMEAYRRLLQEVESKLRKEYAPLLLQKEKEYCNEHVRRDEPRRIWFCWLQGMENAPELVKVCYESLCKNIKDREIVVLTNENLSQYVHLPGYIERKHEKGIIPDAAFTDMLRLELLCKYGGTWIDATVLCTGSEGINDLLDADLFVFQQKPKGGERFVGMSSWMMSSAANNSFLMVVRDLLYEYWREKNCVVDYFLIHLFFCMMAERHPEVVEEMARKGNRIPHYLQRRLADPYDKNWMEELKKHSKFHKLTYRISDKAKRKGTFYDVVIRGSAS